MRRLVRWFLGWPHWRHHALIALAIMAGVGLSAGAAAGAWAGSMFYAGREVAQREIYGRWDWPGLVAPVVACLLAWLAWTAWHRLL